MEEVQGVKKKYLGQTAVVLATFVLSCGLSCWFFSGMSLYEIGRQEQPVYAEEGVGRPLIVIDPGHGGMDGGASGFGGVQEKDINLVIAQNLAEEAEAWGAEVLMTRESDVGLYTDDARTIRQKKREDLLTRKKIIEESGAALAISIHLNSFPQDASVYGAQVFYPKNENQRTGVQKDEHSSKDFAESVQKSLENNISDGRERKAMAKNDILLFDRIKARIILVECGFLSNQNECELLQTAEYQRKLSNAIWEGINEILCLKKVQKIQVIDSTNKDSKIHFF